MRTLLIVEDDAAQRELVRRVLEPKGYQLVEAANGEAAIQLLSNLSEDGLAISLVTFGEIYGHTQHQTLSAHL